MTSHMKNPRFLFILFLFSSLHLMLFAEEGTLKERLEDVDKLFGNDPGIQKIVEFIQAGSDRRVCVPRSSE